MNIDKDTRPVEELKAEEKQRRKQYYEAFKKKNPDYYKQKYAKEKKQNFEKALFNQAKAIAKQRSISFNLKLEDIVIPEFCPLTETPIVKSVGEGRQMNNPYVFIINIDKGYCKENILITCVLANYIRSHTSKEQLMAMAKNWFERNI